MSHPYQHLCGWVNDPAEVEKVMNRLPYPVFGAAAEEIKGSGKGKTVLLYTAFYTVLGAFPKYVAQAIGDCVSHGSRTAIDTLKVIQILKGLRQQWVAETATEPIYGGSRVEIGGGRIRGDGSVGAWAAEWISKYGVLSRLVYGGVDLREYSGDRAKEWGRTGCPDELEPIAKEHPVTTTSQVKTYEEARDAICNGYPVIVCSGQGFTMHRDAEGFAKPHGSWGHCQAFIGADDAYKRPGLLCQNSWGPDWIDGPKRLDQPDGSMWVDADVADRMLAEGDSFAFSGFVGYPSQDLDYLLL